MNRNLKWEEYISFAESYLSDNYVAFVSSAENELWCVYLFDLNGKLKWIADIEEEGSDVRIFDEKYVAASDDYNFYLFDIEGRLLLNSDLLLKQSRIVYNNVKVLSESIGVNFSNLHDNHLLALGSNCDEIALLDINSIPESSI